MERRQKMVLWGVVAAVIGAPILLIALVVLYFWLSLRPVPLEAWVERVRRPGYRLLYSTETPGHSYYAIFDAGKDQLAFCELDRTKHAALVSTSSTVISTPDGEDALDFKGRNSPMLTRKLLGIYVVMDGMEEPIKRGFVGKLRIRHQVDNNAVLDTEVEWGKAPQP